MFAPAWSARSDDDDPGASFFNGARKNVVSSTLRDPEWNNSRVLGPYDADVIRGLRDEVDGSLYVSGSGTLVRALLRDGLVDGLHLFVFPIVLGAGSGSSPTRASRGCDCSRPRPTTAASCTSPTARAEAFGPSAGRPPKECLTVDPAGRHTPKHVFGGRADQRGSAPRPTRCGCRCSRC